MTKPQPEGVENPSRRRALARLGAYAAFTAPAVTTLLIPNKVSAQSVQAGPVQVFADPNDPGSAGACTDIPEGACDP